MVHVGKTQIMDTLHFYLFHLDRFPHEICTVRDNLTHEAQTDLSDVGIRFKNKPLHSINIHFNTDLLTERDSIKLLHHLILPSIPAERAPHGPLNSCQ